MELLSTTRMKLRQLCQENLPNVRKILDRSPKKLQNDRFFFKKKLFKIGSTGPIECNFKALTLVDSRPRVGSYFTQSPITISGKKFLEEIFLPHRATGCQILKISKACQKFGKFRQSWNKNKESILGKKHFLWRSSRYAKSKFDKPAEKKRKKTKTFSSGSKNLQ